jgi:TonB family protein
MRSAWFLTISLTLHIVALVYLLAIYDWQPAQPIAVTILPIEPEINAEKNYGGNGNGGGKSQRLSDQMKKLSPQPEQRAADTERESEPLVHPSAVEVSDKTSEVSITYGSSTVGVELAASAAGSGAVGSSGNGWSGIGSGSGPGRASSPRALITAPARYSSTPKPAYPESARREGREGRVLLRVLIDKLGEAKAVEVSRSSGSDTLDQAATSAIKRWRFYPARSGDQPIESWVSVPIDFQLTEAKN